MTEIPRKTGVFRLPQPETNMNNIRSILSAALLGTALALAFIGCVGTPQQMAATGVYAIGEAVAAKLVSANVPAATITDIAQKLALVPGGTLTPAQYGTLSGEIQLVKDTLHGVQSSGAVPNATSQNYAAIDAFLSGVATGNAAASAGRAPTVNEGIAQAVVTQFTNGLADGVTFAQARNAALAAPKL